MLQLHKQYGLSSSKNSFCKYFSKKLWKQNVKNTSLFLNGSVFLLDNLRPRRDLVALLYVLFCFQVFVFVFHFNYHVLARGNEKSKVLCSGEGLPSCFWYSHVICSPRPDRHIIYSSKGACSVS